MASLDVSGVTSNAFGWGPLQRMPAGFGGAGAAAAAAGSGSAGRAGPRGGVLAAAKEPTSSTALQGATTGDASATAAASAAAASGDAAVADVAGVAAGAGVMDTDADVDVDVVDDAASGDEASDDVDGEAGETVKSAVVAPLPVAGAALLNKATSAVLTTMNSTVPFAFFRKDDRLGRAADWTQANPQAGRGQYRGFGAQQGFGFQQRQQWGQQSAGGQQQGSGASAVAAGAADAPSAAAASSSGVRAADGGDGSFQLVDNSRMLSKQPYGAQRRRQQQGQMQSQYQDRRGNAGGSYGQQGGSYGQQGQGQGQNQRGNNMRGGRDGRDFRGGQRMGRDRFPRLRQSHLEVLASWENLHEFQLPSLAKTTADLPVVTNLVSAGELRAWDKDLDRVVARLAKPVPKTEHIVHRPTTQDDPVLQRLASENAGNVFATDTILAVLMAAGRTQYPWDVVVRRVGNKLFLDSRRDSGLDLLSVNESADMPPGDEDGINSTAQLSVEATLVNDRFRAQAIGVGAQQKKKGAEARKFDEPNPFAGEGSDDTTLPVLYRYRSFKLDDSITIVTRTEVACAADGKSEQTANVFSFLEYDTKLSGNWRQKLDTQRGAVVGQEMRNNMGKIARWAAQSVLAGADVVRFGFITRAAGKDNDKHVLLGVHSVKAADLPVQLNFSQKNMWGILKDIVQFCMTLSEGKYVLLKDANRPVLRVYRVPPETFEADNVDDEDDGEDDGDLEAQNNEDIVDSILEQTNMQAFV